MSCVFNGAVGRPRRSRWRSRWSNELDLPWDAFRLRLIDAIAEQPDRPYYESWAAALESLVVGLDLATEAALDAATPSERPVL